MFRRVKFPNRRESARLGGLRGKIIAWSFVPTAIILAGVALVTFVAYQQVTEDLVLERNQELTRLSANQLVLALAESRERLVAETRRAAMQSEIPELQQEALIRARNRLIIFDGGVLILDNFGKVVAADPERPEIMGHDWSNRSYFRQMLRSTRPVFSDIMNDGSGGEAVIIIAAPIIGPQGEFRGELIGLFRLGATTVSAFYGNLVKLRIAERGTAYLVDSHGRVIYHSDPGYVGQDFSGQDVVKQAITGQLGALRTRDLEDQDIVASFAQAPGTPWSLVIQESWASVIAPSRGYQQFLILLLTAGIVVPVVVVAIGVRRITQPILALIEAAQQVADGNFGHKIITRTGDEIEALTAQFNHMSAQLQVSYDQLEQLVAKQTDKLATLSAVAAVVSRSLELQDVLQDALENVLQVIEAEAGSIYLLDDKNDILNLAAHHGFDSRLTDAVDKLRAGEGFAGRVAQTGQPMVVKDITTDPRLTRLLVKAMGLRSLVSVPLRSKGTVLGVLVTMTRELRDFTPEEVQLLMAIGDQVGVAIENTRLFEGAKRRADQFRVINEVGRSITSILNVEELLETLTRLIQEAFNYYQVGIGLIEDDNVHYKAGAGPLWDDPRFQHHLIPLKIGQDSITGWVAESQQSLLVSDVKQESRYRHIEGSSTRSELAVPIKGRQDVIGVLDVQSDQPHIFDQSDRVVLQSLANQAAIAIENAQLYEQAQHLATLEERQRLARDLHDAVTQGLYSVNLYAEAAIRSLNKQQIELALDHLQELRETVTETMGELRLLIFELRPFPLSERGLAAALEARLEAVEGRAGLRTTFQANGDMALPTHVETALYRISQEALNNVLKHAHAQNVAITLCRDQETFNLEITDDGIGFDPQQVSESGGLGLPGLQERAVQLEAELTIYSQPGAGTQIKVTLAV